MEVRCRPWAEVGPAAAASWASLRAMDPALRSPYFSWEFVDAVAALSGNVEVGVLRHAARTVGYFPFQRDAGRLGRPVGAPMSDYHGLISEPGLAFDPVELLEACGLDRFEFDHLIVEQAPFAPFRRARGSSPYLDLSRGFEAWMQERRRAGRSRFERLKEQRRALARAHGPLRFDFDVRDSGVLDRLLALKSAQYRRTLGAERDLFAIPLMAGLVKRLFSTRVSGLCGILSGLFAGERLVAAHFGLRSGEVLHWWFPSHDPAFSKYSPGTLLLLDLALAASQAGVCVVDFGKGDEPYKLRWATGAFEVAEGWVDVKEARVLRTYLDQELQDARLRRSVVALQREIARLDRIEAERGAAPLDLPSKP